MYFVGSAFGSLYILTDPPKNPKRTFLVQVLLMCFFLTLTPLTIFFKQIAEPILIISFFGAGFSRAFMIIPYLIVADSLDDKSESHYLNVWYSLTAFGDALSLLGLKYLLEAYSWPLCFGFLIVIFFLMCFSLFLVADEIKMNP